MTPMGDTEPIHIYIPGDPADPRAVGDLPDEIIAHRGPALHPDDITVIDGIPVTSVSRTLIAMAEVADREELRACFAAAREQGLLDLERLAAARARVEWRPSLAMLDAVIAEFS